MLEIKKKVRSHRKRLFMSNEHLLLLLTRVKFLIIFIL